MYNPYGTEVLASIIINKNVYELTAYDLRNLEHGNKDRQYDIAFMIVKELNKLHKLCSKL